MVGGSPNRNEVQTGGLHRLCALFLSLLTLSACSPPASPPAAASPGPVTLTIGLPVQTGQDPLHGASQAARLTQLRGTDLSCTRRSSHTLDSHRVCTESADGLTWTLQLASQRTLFTTAHPPTPRQSSSHSSVPSRVPTAIAHLAYPTSTPSKYCLEFSLSIRLRGRSTFLLDDLDGRIAKRGPNGESMGTGPLCQWVLPQITNSSCPRCQTTIEANQRLTGSSGRSYPTVRTAWAAMMRGEIDFLYEVPPDAVEFIEPEDSVKLFSFLRNYEYA